MDKCTIYALYSTKDPSRIRYIGQTIQSVSARISGHRKDLKKWNSALYRWWAKHESEGFKIKHIVVCKGIWNETEVDCIKQARTNGLDLLNLTDGGGGIKGYTRSEEQRRHLSKIKKGVSAGSANGMYGKTHSLEARKRISEAQKKLPPQSLETREKKRLAHLGKSHIIKKVTCPHCGLQGGGGNMTRYHFERCKKIGEGY